MHLKSDLRALFKALCADFIDDVFRVSFHFYGKDTFRSLCNGSYGSCCQCCLYVQHSSKFLCGYRNDGSNFCWKKCGIWGIETHRSRYLAVYLVFDRVHVYYCSRESVPWKLLFPRNSYGAIVWPYYCFLVGISFLYPLCTSLSCFYISQGKTKLVFFSTIGSQCVKLLLAYLFIFGYEEWLSAWGLLGGAMSTLVTQCALCLLLLGVFMSPKNAVTFQSRKIGIFIPNCFGN